MTVTVGLGGSAVVGLGVELATGELGASVGLHRTNATTASNTNAYLNGLPISEFFFFDRIVFEK